MIAPRYKPRGLYRTSTDEPFIIACAKEYFLFLLKYPPPPLLFAYYYSALKYTNFLYNSYKSQK